MGLNLAFVGYGLSADFAVHVESAPTLLLVAFVHFGTSSGSSAGQLSFPRAA